MCYKLKSFVVFFLILDLPATPCYYQEVVIGYQNICSVKFSALISCKIINPCINCLGLPRGRNILGKDNLTP